MNCKIIENELKELNKDILEKRAKLLNKNIDKDGYIINPFNLDNNFAKTYYNKYNQLIVDIIDNGNINKDGWFDKFLKKVNIGNDFALDAKKGRLKGDDGKYLKDENGNYVYDKDYISMLMVLSKDSYNLNILSSNYSIAQQSLKRFKDLDTIVARGNEINKKNYDRYYKNNISLFASNKIFKEINSLDFNTLVTEYKRRLENNIIKESDVPDDIMKQIKIEEDVLLNIRKEEKKLGFEYGDGKYYTRQVTDEDSFKDMFDIIGYDNMKELYNKSILKGHEKKGVELNKDQLDLIEHYAFAKLKKDLDNSLGSKELSIAGRSLIESNKFFTEVEKIIKNDTEKLDILLSENKYFTDNFKDKKMLLEIVENIKGDIKSPSYQKRRIILDPFEEIIVNNKKYKMNDIMKKDNEMLMREIIRSHSTHITFEKNKNIKLPSGEIVDITSFNNFKHFLSENLHHKGLDTKRLLERYNETRLGGIEETKYYDGTTNEVLGIARDITSGTMLPNAWYSNLSEMTNQIAFSQFKNISENLHISHRAMRELSSGKPLNELSIETQTLYNDYKYLFNDYFDNTGGFRNEGNNINDINSPHKTLMKIRNISNKYSKWMMKYPGRLFYITTLSRTMGHLGIRRRFVESIKETGMLNLSEKNIKDLGLNNDDILKFKQHFDKYNIKNYSIKEIDKIIDEMDIEMKTFFDNIVETKNYQLTLDPTTGEHLSFIKRDPLLKTATQFQSFVINAYTSQTLISMKHRDREAIISTLSQMFIMFIVSSIRNYDKNINDKKKLKEKMEITNLIKEASLSTTMGAPFSLATNLALSLIPGAEPLNTTLGGSRFHNSLLNPPSVQYASKIKDFTNKLLFDSENIKYNDFNKIMPYIVGTNSVLKSIGLTNDFDENLK
jgi:hypothetical protein